MGEIWDFISSQFSLWNFVPSPSLIMVDMDLQCLDFIFFSIVFFLQYNTIVNNVKFFMYVIQKKKKKKEGLTMKERWWELNTYKTEV